MSLLQDRTDPIYCKHSDSKPPVTQLRPELSYSILWCCATARLSEAPTLPVMCCCTTGRKMDMSRMNPNRDHAQPLCCERCAFSALVTKHYGDCVSLWHLLLANEDTQNAEVDIITKIPSQHASTARRNSYCLPVLCDRSRPLSLRGVLEGAIDAVTLARIIFLTIVAHLQIPGAVGLRLICS
jgi:hypothetical protein